MFLDIKLIPQIIAGTFTRVNLINLLNLWLFRVIIKITMFCVINCEKIIVSFPLFRALINSPIRFRENT
jgi:hypothetical protein